LPSFALGDSDAIAQEEEFLFSLRRFNVLASRARAKGVVLVSQQVVDHLSGDADTLRDSRLLKLYADAFCQQPRSLTLGYHRDGQPQFVTGVLRAR
jgi:DNA replication ATP-dependent helicase/nuclease Dna2